MYTFHSNSQSGSPNEVSLIKRKHIFITAAVVLVCVILKAALFNELTITEYTIETNKLNEPVRVVIIADLHSCLYGDQQEELISAIDARNPDIILMPGDIADDMVPHVGTIVLLKGIADRYPCFYVTGNHEFWSGEVDSIKDIFREHLVSVLEGTLEVVEINGQGLNICGVDDPSVGEAAFQAQSESAIAAIDDNLYTIFLSHRPELFESQSMYNCDLIVAGHAHGGQWRIPYILDGLYAPNQGVFPEYTSGIYTLNDTNMLVSRGLSRKSSRIPRLFNPPELVVLDIVPR